MLNNPCDLVYLQSVMPVYHSVFGLNSVFNAEVILGGLNQEKALVVRSSSLETPVLPRAVRCIGVGDRQCVMTIEDGTAD